MMSLENKEERKVALVPGCMLCPSFQAVRSEKNLEWPKQIIPFFLEHNIGMIPMPCPEITFEGLESGAARLPHGVDYYEQAPGFVSHCGQLGIAAANQIEELQQAGFTVVAVVGIEHSPTCAASFMYTRRGTVKRQGIFLSVITRELEKKGIHIPTVGINRRSTHKFLEKMMEL